MGQSFYRQLQEILTTPQPRSPVTGRTIIIIFFTRSKRDIIIIIVVVIRSSSNSSNRSNIYPNIKRRS